MYFLRLSNLHLMRVFLSDEDSDIDDFDLRIAHIFIINYYLISSKEFEGVQADMSTISKSSQTQYGKWEFV